MASFSVTQAVAALEAAAVTGAIDAGTAAVFEIYAGTLPANADASSAGLTLLASLPCSATFSSGLSDTGSASRITAATITADSSADATGTATTWRIKTQTGGTVCCQGDAGTASTSLILNTVSIVAGATVSVSALTIDIPEGP